MERRGFIAGLAASTALVSTSTHLMPPQLSDIDTMIWQAKRAKSSPLIRPITVDGEQYYSVFVSSDDYDWWAELNPDLADAAAKVFANA
jgi:hypothetical protein